MTSWYATLHPAKPAQASRQSEARADISPKAADAGSARRHRRAGVVSRSSDGSSSAAAVPPTPQTPNRTPKRSPAHGEVVASPVLTTAAPYRAAPAGQDRPP